MGSTSKPRFSFGGDLDKSSGRFHLSNLEQVRPILERFLKDIDMELYLLQIDTEKLGDGLVYEVGEGNEWFPYYYGVWTIKKLRSASSGSSH